jgi:hypothetical protein
MSSPVLNVSSGDMPAVGSSRSRSCGCSASAIPISSHAVPVRKGSSKLAAVRRQIEKRSSRSFLDDAPAPEKRSCSAIWIFCRTGNSLKTLGACILMTHAALHPRKTAALR